MTSLWFMPIRELIRFLFWWGIAMPKRLLLMGWDLLLATDDTLRLANNVKFWLAFEPMFGDYDWRGHLVGFFLRGVRVLASIVAYVAVIGLALALPLAWYGITIAAVIVLLSKPWTL